VVVLYPRIYFIRIEPSSIEVHAFMTSPGYVILEKTYGFRKQARRRVVSRHRRLHCVEPVVVHVERNERPGLIAVVEELQLMSFGSMAQVIPHAVRNRDISLHDTKRRVYHRAAHIIFPGLLAAAF